MWRGDTLGIMVYVVNLGWPGEKVRPYLQINQNKKGGVVQAVEYLSSKCKALSSNPSITKNELWVS
jgi:hypothetical protein